MERRHKIAWLVVVAALGLTLIPAMDASARTSKQSASEKKQNQRIQRALNQVAAVGANVTAITAQLATANTTASGIDARLKVIEGAAPAIISGLTQLKDGLTAVAAGLQTAGAGLTSLKTLVTSTEYGVGQVLIGGVPAGGSFVVTPDIPDSVQQAQTTQAFNAGAGSGVISVLVAVRSNESDGTGASNPAAHCRVTVVDSAGHTTTSLPTPPGAGIGTAPFYPIPLKSAQTSTDPANAGFPFGLKSTGADADHPVDLTDTTAMTGNAAAPDGTPATAVPTKSYTVSLSCVDLSPSATDPSA